MNIVVIGGRLGKDPELKRIGDNQTPICNFSLATTEFAKEGEKKTEWHSVVAWGKTAENVAKYLRKGSECNIEGRLVTREWEKDGEKRYKTEIVANRVEFVGAKAAASVDTIVDAIDF